MRRLKVGDLVRTPFIAGESKIVRTVTAVRGDGNCDSGQLAKADGGSVCKECGYKGKDTLFLDSGWFYRVARRKR